MTSFGRGWGRALVSGKFPKASAGRRQLHCLSPCLCSGGNRLTRVVAVDDTVSKMLQERGVSGGLAY